MTRATVRIAFAALAVLGVALAAVVFIMPGVQQSGAQGSSAVTAVVTSSGGNATYTQGPGMAVSSPACSGSTEAYGNMSWTVSPCVTYGFPSATVKNATLDSSQVLPFIKSAYEYHLVYFAYSRTYANVMYAVLNVTGSQAVAGNWTSGYVVSYIGDRLVNVTVLQVIPSHFEVSHVSSYPLPDRSVTVAYTPQQAEAIQVALSDTKVKSLMVAPPYYAELVGSSGNGTVGSSYLVQLYQVNGTGVIGVFVDSSLNATISSYTQQRFSGVCYANGIVIADPWYARGYIACTA